MDAYHLIDARGQGRVSAQELSDELRARLGLFPILTQVELFVKRYDRDSDRRLSYSEFCDAFTPKTSHYA